MNIIRLRHAWPENEHFSIRHKGNRSDFIFICFHTPVILELCGKSQKVEAGGCIVFDKDTEAYFECPVPLIHDWMHFEGDVQQLLERFSLKTDVVYYPKSIEFVTAIIRELESEFFSQKEFYEDMCTSKLCELFLKLSRSSVLYRNVEIVPEGTVKNFIDLRSAVFSSLSAEWTIEKMAKRVMLSPSRFHAIYREVFGISPKNDIICARIEYAKNILRKGYMSIDETARHSGFGSSFNFIRQFKKHTGMTPGEFRKSVL